jgi:hypothetical protein
VNGQQVSAYLPPAPEGFARPFFIHIAKNAGQTIEDSGYAAGIRWGAHVWNTPDNPVKLSMPDGNPCSWFHVPPDDLPVGNRSMYEGAEVFCVTRHPYARALSQYKWITRQFPAIAPDDARRLEAHPVCSVEGLNFFLQQTLLAYMDNQEFLQDCHIIPQVRYIFGRERNWCTRIIPIESLSAGFDSLMAERGLQQAATRAITAQD